MHDMLGLTAAPAKFVKNFMAGVSGQGDAVAQAARRYVAEVEAGTFPGPEHVYGLAAETVTALYGTQSSGSHK
jgi:3-methyl-2-oxobutanoate hydroxymethyltransferase